jgi:hypothetical protein
METRRWRDGNFMHPDCLSATITPFPLAYHVIMTEKIPQAMALQPKQV